MTAARDHWAHDWQAWNGGYRCLLCEAIATPGTNLAGVPPCTRQRREADYTPSGPTTSETYFVVRGQRYSAAQLLDMLNDLIVAHKDCLPKNTVDDWMIRLKHEYADYVPRSELDVANGMIAALRAEIEQVRSGK